MMAYWDWWVGALALGSITFFYHLLVGRRFGVSSAWERVVHWKVERETERSDQTLTAAPDDFQAALMAATQSQFGASGGGVAVSSPPDQAVESTPPPQTRLPMTANAILLVTILLGAFGAALIHGRFKIAGDMGPAFADIVVDGPLLWPTLFGGGVLVGIGTRMAGGCSSGHGMSGCSRLQPVSLVATSVFFGTAVAVSSLLLWVI